jgi:hypothetical protein
MEEKWKTCESCLVLMPMKQLARFGTHKGSPLFCRRCAEAHWAKHELLTGMGRKKEFAELKRGDKAKVIK